MSYNSEASRKAAETMRQRDPEHFKKMGVKGGQYTGMKGFAKMDMNKVKAASLKGGKVSKRGHKYLYQKSGYRYYIKLSTGEQVKYHE
jgi:general stress protein YciG